MSPFADQILRTQLIVAQCIGYLHSTNLDYRIYANKMQAPI